MTSSARGVGSVIATSSWRRGNQLAQPGVLALKLLEAFGLVVLQAAVLLAPAVIALLGNTGLLAGQLGGLSTAHRYFDEPRLRDDLFGGKALAGYLRLLLASVEFSLSTWTRNNRSRHVTPDRASGHAQPSQFALRSDGKIQEGSDTQSAAIGG